MVKKKKHSILRLRKKSPCPTGTKTHKDRKKEDKKKWCRKKGDKK